MSDASVYYRTLIAQTNNLISQLQIMETFADRLTSDPSLAAAAAAAANMAGRTDLTTADFNNAIGAIDQILFAFNSGSPTQKSYLYKLL